MQQFHFSKTIAVYLGLLICCTATGKTLQAEEIVTDQARDELISQMDTFDKKPVTVPPQTRDYEIVEEEEKELLPEEAGPSFYVEKITIEGNHTVPLEDLTSYTEPFLGKTLNFLELKKLTQLITNHYRSLGYITSRAYIPPQDINDKEVLIRIAEGKAGEVFVEGNKYFKSKLYQSALSVNSNEIFRYQDLETSLYFLNQKPDRKAKGYLIQGLEPQTSDIILKATESLPIHASYEFHNRGTKFTHRARHSLTLTHNNILGLGDTLTASLTHAEEDAFFASAFNYSLPIEKTKTVVDISASTARSRLIKNLKPFEVEGESYSLSTAVRQTLYRSLKSQLFLHGSFEIRDSKTSLSDHKLSFDRLRVLAFGPSFLFYDKTGRTILSSSFRLGIPGFLGARERDDDRASKRFTGGDFTSYKANFTRIQKLPLKAILNVKACGHWTWDNLTSLVQFRGGGAFSVRGYPESETSGDYGYQFSGEIQIPPYFIPKSINIPFTQKNLYDSLHFIAFLDGAKTFNHRRQQITGVKDKFLLSSGFGVRFNAGRNVAFSLDWGFPFGDKSSDPKDSGQIHLSVRVGV